MGKQFSKYTNLFLIQAERLGEKEQGGGQSLLYLEYELMSICKVPKLSLISYDA